MTNEQKYKTAEERVRAFEKFCKSRDCEDCAICKRITKDSECWVHWLTLEAEDEKPESCPFCGGMCVAYDKVVACQNDKCDYRSGSCDNRNAAISAHNRVARAVRAAKEGEAK